MKRIFLIFLTLLIVSGPVGAQGGGFQQPGMPPPNGPPQPGYSEPQFFKKNSSMMESYHDVLPDDETMPDSRYLPTGIETFALTTGLALFAICLTLDHFVVPWLKGREEQDPVPEAEKSA